MRRKGLFVILDGLGDRPVASLGGRTPLEAARTPNLDQLARDGLTGQVDPLTFGVAVSTAVGTGILLGLPPGQVDRLKRGPVEAAGAGLRLGPGDVAIRCNLATLERNGDRLRIVDRRAGRIREGTEAIAETVSDVSLPGGISVTLRGASQHRAVLRLRGPGLSPEVSDTDPGLGAPEPFVLTSLPQRPDEPGAVRTANAVNALVNALPEVLADHPVNRARIAEGLPPANGIITRGAGVGTGVGSLVHHLGLRAALVAGERTVVGLGRLFGYTVVVEPSFTGMPDTDVGAKVAAGLSALDSHDIVFVDVKAPDILAHDREPLAKRDFLERVDRALGPALARSELVIAVSGDHTTDSTTGRHTGDPVPGVIRAAGGRTDGSEAFGESACQRGGLGRVTGAGFLRIVLDAIGAMEEFRATDRPFL